MKRVLIIVCMVIAQFVFGQSLRQTIRGQVVDADSKSPVFGANVVVLGLDSFIGSATDIDGKFRLQNVPVGRQNIKISSVGYEERILSNIIVTSGKEVVLTIDLREMVYTVDEVVVIATPDKTKANNELVTNSARSFRSEETERFAGSRADPSRMAANFAGVVSGNDARNDIIVRGNSPIGVLWRMEGVDIPNPNHFSAQGATGGAISMLNNNVLGNCDFLTGAFPAEYGNKTAAVFDLKIRNGNNEKNEFVAQMGLNGLEAGAEGPISKKNGSSFLINYRYSTLDLFKKLGISFGVSGVPRYQDGSFKINLPLAQKTTLSVWGLGGISNIEIKDSEKQDGDWSFSDKGEDLIFTSGMMTGGVNINHFVNSKFSVKLSVAGAATTFLVNIDTLSNNNDPFKVFRNKSTDGHYMGNLSFTYKHNARHLFKTGVLYSDLFYNYHSYSYRKSVGGYVDVLNANDRAGVIQSYVHWQFRLLETLTWNTGFHYQQFLLNGSSAYEPRSGLRWQFTKRQSLSLAYGLHSQMVPLIYYFYKTQNQTTGEYDLSNQDLDLTRSHHIIMGYDLNPGNNYRVKVELYKQWLYDIPVQKNISSSFSMVNAGSDISGLDLVDSLHNAGTGSNHGVELTIEKIFSNHFYFLNTLSLFESRYKGSDGIDRNSAFSGGYVYNLLGGYEIPLGKSKNKFLSIDLKTTFAGGNRYTPADVTASIVEKRGVYIDSLAYTRQYKNYNRVDLKIAFKINRKRSTQSFYISVENIMNTKNILRETFDASKGELVNEYQLGLFPYGGYRIEF